MIESLDKCTMNTELELTKDNTIFRNAYQPTTIVIPEKIITDLESLQVNLFIIYCRVY